MIKLFCMLFLSVGLFCEECVPKIFSMYCDEPWFSYLRDEIKPVEGRINKPQYQKIREGDYIDFISEGDQFRVQVTEIRKYPNVMDYLTDVTLEKALPGVSSLGEGERIYFQWNTPEEIERWGFLAIFVKKLGREGGGD